MSILLLMDDDDPSPSFSANFMSGSLPAGLTYTNSSTVRTYFGSDGLLKTAAANEAIFEYNPLTLALLGMRWEIEQRTNLCLYSTLAGGGAAPTGWTQTVATGTSAPAASTYGNADGSVAYTQTATAQRPFIAQTVTVEANTAYTLSFLVETTTALTAIDIIGAASIPAGTSASYPVCSANPAGGSGGAITVGSLELRLTTVGTAGTAIIRCGLGSNGAATGTIKFSRPQFEDGAPRSSFIPTAAAAVTRQPDALTASSISWYRQDEGTVVFECIPSTPATTQRGMYLFSDGTDNERMGGYRASGLTGGYLVVDGGVTQADVSTLSSMAQSAVSRHAFAYKVNDFAGSVNGGAPVADAAGTIPTVTGLKLGQGNTAGTQAFMGYARRFQYFNTRLPDPTIQGLSRV